MKSRKFTFEDQEVFARISGDYNPAHLDAIAARRFQFGQPVVHGIHLLLWALDCWLRGRRRPAALVSITALFKKPVTVGGGVRCSLSSRSGNSVTIKLCVENSEVAAITAGWGAPEPNPEKVLSGKNPAYRNCKVMAPGEAAGVSGKLDLRVNAAAASMLFPDVIKKMPLQQVAELLAISRLVGMECPGYHSMLSAVDATFVKTTGRSSSLTYAVSDYDERFSLCSVRACGPGLRGMVKAFFRPPPREQESFTDMRAKVDMKEFKGQNALIIGGSRGLGEVAAKLLAAGGAKVRITFHKGEEDARRLVKEIVSGRGSADCVFFDVLNIEPDAADKLHKKIKPTHLYYFATPPIFAVRYKKRFSPKLFENFCRYYITGFAATVEILRAAAPGFANVFYPSSTAIDELLSSVSEYACAKAAGETLCAFLEKYHKDIFIYRPRLSRMATDQTVSLLADNGRDPALIILKHLRVFRDRGKAK